MADGHGAVPGAGWYPDPAGSGGERYWDGATWTARTRADPPCEPPEPPETPRRRTRALLLVGALVAMLAVGVGVGLSVGGLLGTDPGTASDPAEPEPTASGDSDLPIWLPLVAELDRPTDRFDSVSFTDVAALRDAGIVSDPEPGGDGWSTALQSGSVGAMPVGSPYFELAQLRRAVPMEYAIGLAHDEIAASVGQVQMVPRWFVPAGDDQTVRDRLRSSTLWSEIDTDSFERVADITAEVLGGYELDSVEERRMASFPASAELRAGALRLDAGEFTSRNDPLGQDPAWSALIGRLAAERAVSGVLLAHGELTELPEGGTPLQPASAVAMASVIEGEELSDLLVLEHDDPGAAAANAAAASANLELLEGLGYHEGDVVVDATTVLVRLRLVGPPPGTSDLFATMRRFPLGPLNLVIGVGEAADDQAGSGPPAGDAPLEGASITVAAKDFDEQLILGEISVALLEHAGARVTSQVGMGGTDATRGALEAGEIDHYWEYTGTAWISFFGETEPIPDRVEQYEAVRDRDAAERGLFWLEPTPFNNTYGIAMSQEANAELGGIDTISELGALLRSDPAAATLCVESEFSARDDGLPGMEAHYGFEVPGGNVTVMDFGPIYGAVAARSPCTFGEVFTTDGRIAVLDLKVLEDDLAFFPLYNPAPVFIEDVWTEYGQTLEQLFAPVAAALDDDTMRQLNARVSAGGERPADVARDWLTASGFID